MDINLVRKKITWENLSLIFTLLSILSITYTSFVDPEDIVVIAFLSWSIVVFSSVIVFKLNNVNANIYIFYAIADLTIAVIAYLITKNLGANLGESLILLLAVVIISAVLVIGRTKTALCNSLNIFVTALPNFARINYYIGDNTVNHIFIYGMLFGITALFIQLFSLKNSFLNLSVLE